MPSALGVVPARHASTERPPRYPRTTLYNAAGHCPGRRLDDAGDPRSARRAPAVRQWWPAAAAVGAQNEVGERAIRVLGPPREHRLGEREDDCGIVNLG